MQIKTYNIEGLALLTPKKFGDNRGYFMEAFKAAWFRESVADVTFVQDNQSLSGQVGTIRGLHYQKLPCGQGKLVRCLRGAIFDVAVDIRPESSTFGQWVGETLTPDNALQLWIPEGFAHGFCTLEPDTEVFYKVTSPYSPTHDAGLAFDDPEIGIEWPIDLAAAVLSDKDKVQPKLSSLR
ncbi:dTDP-4-dehydrorhamnose 3,5-epimerase [Asticcacaulis excentricus]|uniref:dTDP-4-dehydrorhamnose 3,5-epimerase n=1 Tax=Asticcacaulis excentricus (strain ATCC 15261 / DSM 4724 / KCTC 12464 / NCIMB 9791 / VKM B-1370 / CB 48) TaxID=573065 RepID=E8RMN5_ASTEC|nr:dTDP-4-dehydrorhamnose 3,5-epimerase [Asticcacaulis excentricus]ADU13916.1 dTDP-4-dehydrorhamnose 3,5-epimerase [Asticcacaulis excentricus CB 48]